MTASGTVGQRLDLDVAFDNVPASLAAAAASGIDPQGTLNGTARATGTLSAPRADYDLRLTASRSRRRARPASARSTSPRAAPSPTTA